MPVMKNKYQHIKVFRPDGTRYAEGTQEMPVWSAEGQRHTFSIVCEIAIENALYAFCKEFGQWPNLRRLVVELVEVNGNVKATVLEVPDDD